MSDLDWRKVGARFFLTRREVVDCTHLEVDRDDRNHFWVRDQWDNHAHLVTRAQAEFIVAALRELLDAPAPKEAAGER